MNMFSRKVPPLGTKLVNVLLSERLSVIVTCKLNNCYRTFPLLTHVTSRSNHFYKNKFINVNFQTARTFSTNFGQSNPKQTGSTVNRKYLLLATYVSFGIGACLFAAIAFKYSEKVRRRTKGIEDEKYKGRRTLFIRYKGFVLPKFVENVLGKLETFDVKTDDVWIISFPRSGTTWTQEMVYLINTNMDIKTAKSLSIDERFPYLEYITPGVDAVSKMPSPRYIKSHMPLKFLPKDLTKGKVIYVARNPKDIAVSYYHFAKMLKTFDGEFKDFLHEFVNSKVGYSPWSEHVLDFWKLRDNPNVLFLTYEDMMEDLEGCIEKVAHFLNKSVTAADVKVIANHCSFTNMKTNEQVNYEWMRDLGVWDKSDPKNAFLRKGKVGGWRKYFDEETNYKMNRMIAHNLHDSGLHFKYDLNE